MKRGGTCGGTSGLNVGSAGASCEVGICPGGRWLSGADVGAVLQPLRQISIQSSSQEVRVMIMGTSSMPDRHNYPGTDHSAPFTPDIGSQYVG
jgi:hypothetical protein